MCKFARDKTAGSSVRRKRIAVWGLSIILGSTLLLPLASYVYTDLVAAVAAERKTNPRANYWRAVRLGDKGYTAVTGQKLDGTAANKEYNVLTLNSGQNWRLLRNGPAANISAWVLAVILASILLFVIVRGQVKLERRPSGRLVRRWSLAERVLHWYTATLFIILAITGLSLFFGRAVLVPVFGYEGFSAYAQASIYVHNYLGPFFIVGVVLEIIAWVRYTIPNKTDWEWIKQGGGILSKGKHPHSEHINAGEKIITFWAGLAILGLTVSITGLYLLGWIGSGMRETMQTANLVHSIAAVLWTAIQLGHIYLGAWGVEGSFQGMWKGEVSEEWAKQHHDLWYEEVKKG